MSRHPGAVGSDVLGEQAAGHDDRIRPGATQRVEVARSVDECLDPVDDDVVLLLEPGQSFVEQVHDPEIAPWLHDGGDLWWGRIEPPRRA